MITDQYGNNRFKISYKNREVPLYYKKLLLPYVLIKVSIMITDQYGNNRFLKIFFFF